MRAPGLPGLTRCGSVAASHPDIGPRLLIAPLFHSCTNPRLPLRCPNLPPPPTAAPLTAVQTTSTTCTSTTSAPGRGPTSALGFLRASRPRPATATALSRARAGSTYSAATTNEVPRALVEDRDPRAGLAGRRGASRALGPAVGRFDRRALPAYAPPKTRLEYNRCRYGR